MLISDGLICSGSELTVHHSLLSRQAEMNRCKKTWFACADKTPLEWYATILNAAPVSLIMSKYGDIPADTKQCWVASPYHAQLGRDQVRVMSEGAFPWCAEDGVWICEALNSLLNEEGMHLLYVGAAMLLACREAMNVHPISFAQISGKILPNRHPEGADGGRLMRLISEIQMTLHGKQASQRSGQPDIHGLWFWGESTWPANAPEGMPSVTTRNPFLQAVTDGKDAKMMITEVERMDELMKQGAPLPKKIVLTGGGHAVLLTKSLLPKFGKASWIPGSAKAESELLSVLRSAA